MAVAAKTASKRIGATEEEPATRVLRRFRELRMVSIHRNEVFFHENVASLEALARPIQDLIGE